jgi:hypothetical protein
VSSAAIEMKDVHESGVVTDHVPTCGETSKQKEGEKRRNEKQYRKVLK